MKSKTTRQFRELYLQLPQRVRKQAREAYRQFQVNPATPGLNFERIGGSRALIYSARVSEQYRVLGRRDDDTIVWFWIGTHSDYDKLIGRL
ncbi:MAG TPA: hypothetical protein VF120_17035 [Ktedonobacterales bacterium]